MNTPITDAATHEEVEVFKRLELELADAKLRLRQIQFICDAPHWTIERRYRIRDIASQEFKS